MPTRRNPQIFIHVEFPQFSRELLTGITSYMRMLSHRWHVRFINRRELLGRLHQEHIDGVIVALQPTDTSYIAELLETGVPLVNLLFDCLPNMASVIADEMATGAAAAEHLLGRGFQNLAFLGFDAGWSRARQSGFVQAVAQSGRPCLLPSMFADETDYRFLENPKAASALHQWVRKLPRPLGMAVCSDDVAATAMQILAAHRVRFPHDIGLVGVGNLPATCLLTPVPLSSVAMDFPAMGYRAAQLLDQLIAGKPMPDAAVKVAPTGVAIRRSTDAFHFDDENVRSALRIIHDRAADGLTVKQLIQQLPVSRQWLTRRFNELVGHTPAHEIRKVRIERVRDLLVGTDLSLNQIASLCGYSQPENLIRAFRDAYGHPPIEYRTRFSAHA